MIYARAIHFAATLMAAGVVFFIILIAVPALRAVRDESGVRAALWPKLAFIAWFSLILAAGSSVAWLVLVAASMSGEPPSGVFSGGVLWTVITQTHFGSDWTIRLVLAGLLAAILAPLLSAHERRPWIGAAAVILAAAFAGSLAWAGHATGAEGSEAVIHPVADFLHLVAAAAWVGALIPLALLLSATGGKDASTAIARTAVLRFSTLGVVSVATLLVTGTIDAWYLVGSIAALTGTYYGKLLLAKIALFVAMVAVAAVNRFYFTPRLHSDDAGASRPALSQLRRNAVIEAVGGAAVICLVAVLGTQPPAIHAAHQHGDHEHADHQAAAESGAIPDDASFVHIHTEQGMADVMVEPGRAGRAHATVHLWNDDSEPLPARAVQFSVTAPAAGSRPTTFAATQDADGAWQVDGLEFSQAGNWMVSVDAGFADNRHIILAAPIVIDPAP